jgi:hypothetical protein
MVCVLAGIRSETCFFSLPQFRSPARTSAEVKATATNNSSTMHATRWERFVIVTVMLFSLSITTGINKYHPILAPQEWPLCFLLKACGASGKNSTLRMPQLHQESLNEGSAHSLTSNLVFLCAPPVPNRLKTIYWT